MSTIAPAVTIKEVRWLVEHATRAPSIHNTQPWRFRWTGTAVELYSDASRGLRFADPAGRERVLSCGAALYDLRLALRKLGYDALVEVTPDRHQPEFLARVTIGQERPADVDERLLFAASLRRHTHRGEFEDRPIAADLAVRLQQAADVELGLLLYVHDPGQRQRVLHLTRAAERHLAGDERARNELRAWTPAPGSARRDGVPARAYPADPASDADDIAPRDFDLGRGYGTTGASPQAPGGIAVLATARDLAVDWLQAGQALEHVLVVAAAHDAFAALHSQVIEVPNLREELRRELCTAYYPQILMRFGYASDAAPTPRRPIDDVLAFG